MDTPEARLRDFIAQKEVVVVVGAGVSIGATIDADGKPHPCASWTGLINNGIKWLRGLQGQELLANAAEAMVAAKSLETAAGAIVEGLGLSYADWLQAAFNQENFHITHPEVPRALHNLGLPLLTTNYDSVLELGGPRQTLIWDSGEAWQQSERYPEQYVLHIHGSYIDSSSVVFSKEQYWALANDITSQSWWHTIATRKHLLFVGLGGSFDDLNFTRLQKYLKDVLGQTGPEHYRLVHRGQVTDEDTAKMAAKKIRDVVYGASTDDLAGFLAELAPPRAPSIPTIVTPQQQPEIVLTVEVKRETVNAYLLRGKERIGQLDKEMRHGLTKTTLETISLLDQWIRDDPLSPHLPIAAGSTTDLPARVPPTTERDSRSRVMQQIGRILFEAIFEGGVLELYQKGLQQAAELGRDGANVRATLAIRLNVAEERVILFKGDQDVDLRDLPWELLWDNDGHLSAADHVTLVRVATAQNKSLPISAREPGEKLTILIALAQPTKLIGQVHATTADCHKVIAGISAAISAPQSNRTGADPGWASRINAIRLDGQELISPDDAKEARIAVTWERFQQAFPDPMRDSDAGRPEHVDVVHFIGHSGTEMGSRQRFVAFEAADKGDSDQNGEINWVPFDDVGRFFRDLDEEDRPTLVVLHLCRGFPGSVTGSKDLSRASFSALGLRLLEAHIPLVVAMQYPMWPDVGQEFTRAFYREVDKTTVARAVQTARRGISVRNWAGPGGPILFMDGGIRQILTPRIHVDNADSQPALVRPEVDKQRPASRSDRKVESNRPTVPTRSIPKAPPVPSGGQVDVFS